MRALFGFLAALLALVLVATPVVVLGMFLFGLFLRHS